jgi:hypothetical protein
VTTVVSTVTKSAGRFSPPLQSWPFCPVTGTTASVETAKETTAWLRRNETVPKFTLQQQLSKLSQTDKVSFSPGSFVYS